MNPILENLNILLFAYENRKPKIKHDTKNGQIEMLQKSQYQVEWMICKKYLTVNY